MSRSSIDGDKSADRMKSLSKNLLNIEAIDCVGFLCDFLQAISNVSNKPSLKSVKSWFGLPINSKAVCPSKVYQLGIASYFSEKIKNSSGLDVPREKVIDALFIHHSQENLNSLIDICSTEKNSHFAAAYRLNALGSNVDNIEYFKKIEGEWFVYRLHSTHSDCVVRELLIIENSTRTTALCRLHTYQLPAVGVTEKRGELAGTVYPIYSNDNDNDKRLVIIVGGPGMTKTNYFSLCIFADTRGANDIFPAVLIGLSDIEARLSSGPVFLRKVTRDENSTEKLHHDLQSEKFDQGACDTNSKPRDTVIGSFHNGEIYDRYYKALQELCGSPILISADDSSKLN